MIAPRAMDQWEVERLRNEYLATVDPWVRWKLRVMNSCVPSITYFSDAQYPVIQYPEWALSIMQQCDQQIEEIGKAFNERAG